MSPHRWIAFSIFMAPLLELGCGGAQIPPPSTEDPDGLSTDLGLTCQQMRRVGCSDGLPSAQTCYQRLQGRPSKVPIDCILKASSIDEVRSCGTSQTTRFRCRND